jgi:hypothetical protein
MRTLNKEGQHGLTPQNAYQILVDGNQRFVSNLRYNRNLLQQVNESFSSFTALSTTMFYSLYMLYLFNLF